MTGASDQALQRQIRCPLPNLDVRVTLLLHWGLERFSGCAGGRVAVAADSRREYGYLQIGEVAERTGVTQRTLRFYEEKGLLKPPSRMEGGFRLYSAEDVQRVERIRQMQNLLGFTL